MVSVMCMPRISTDYRPHCHVCAEILLHAGNTSSARGPGGDLWGWLKQRGEFDGSVEKGGMWMARGRVMRRGWDRFVEGNGALSEYTRSLSCCAA